MTESWELVLLFGTGIGAGFVDSIAGGGGLITLPVLLAVCPDPKLALGTNKLQASFGSGSATYHYARAGALSLADCRRACLLAFIGSVMGSFLVQQLDPMLLKRIVPVALLLVALYVWFKPQLGEKDIHPRMSRLRFDFLCAFGLGFNLTKATAHTKALNFASNLASLIVFLIAQKILFVAGLTMGAGQWLGARAGSGMVMTRGTKFIRPVFLTVVILITLKMLYTAYWPAKG